MALFLAFRAAVLLSRVVPLRVSYAIARGAGLLAYFAWAGGRRRCIQNMLRVVDGDQRAARRAARRSFSNYVVYLVDFFRFFSTNAEDITRRVAIDEQMWGRLREHRSGRGIVFLTIHFGNWDLGAAVLALNGFPISAIADRFRNERMDRLIMASREHLGMRVIPAGRTGPGIVRALRSNDVVAMLVDIPQMDDGVHVQFFGDTISVPAGPARIALRAGSSVVAAVLPRLRRWSDEVGVEFAPVRYEATGDTDHDVQALTQQVFAYLEGVVRRHPDQWYIFRNLWVADAARTAAR